MALTDADILVIILVIQTVRPVRQPLTPAAAAVRPKTDVIQRLVTILMRPVARLTVTKQAVLAGLIPVPMVAAVQELAVLLALILNRLLPPLPAAPEVAPAAVPTHRLVVILSSIQAMLQTVRTTETKLTGKV